MSDHSYGVARKVSALCHTCDKRWTGKNAQGVGARHARAHNHKVHVEIAMDVWYGPWPRVVKDTE